MHDLTECFVKNIGMWQKTLTRKNWSFRTSSGTTINVSRGGVKAQYAAAVSSGHTGLLCLGTGIGGMGSSPSSSSKLFPSAGGGLCIRLIISALEDSKYSSFAPKCDLKWVNSANAPHFSWLWFNIPLLTRDAFFCNQIDELSQLVCNPVTNLKQNIQTVI